MSRKELQIDDITAVIDTREQLPWNLSPLKSTSGTLETADYSVLGLESFIRVERKSLEDLIGCVGVHRDRFDREIQRLLAYPQRCVIVESSWQAMELGWWRSKVSQKAAMGSVLGWMALGVPFLFAGDATAAGEAAARFLFISARRRFEELGSFYENLKIVNQ